MKILFLFTLSLSTLAPQGFAGARVGGTDVEYSSYSGMIFPSVRARSILRGNPCARAAVVSAIGFIATAARKAGVDIPTEYEIDNVQFLSSIDSVTLNVNGTELITVAYPNGEHCAVSQARVSRSVHS